MAPNAGNFDKEHLDKLQNRKKKTIQFSKLSEPEQSYLVDTSISMKKYKRNLSEYKTNKSNQQIIDHEIGLGLHGALQLSKLKLRREYYNQVMQANDNFIIERNKKEAVRKVAHRAIVSLKNIEFEKVIKDAYKDGLDLEVANVEGHKS